MEYPNLQPDQSDKENNKPPRLQALPKRPRHQAQGPANNGPASDPPEAIRIFFPVFREVVKGALRVENNDFIRNIPAIRSILLDPMWVNREVLEDVASRDWRMLEEAKPFVSLLSEVLTWSCDIIDGERGNESPEDLQNALLAHYVLMPMVVDLRNECGLRWGPGYSVPPWTGPTQI